MSKQVRLLLVATHIYNSINTLLAKNTIVIQYDFYNPTQSLSALASNICNAIPPRSTVLSIGFMYHSTPLHLQLFKHDVSRNTTTSTNEFKDINLFLSSLYVVSKTTQFDFITCSLVPHNTNALSLLASELSIIHNKNFTINASTDDTGINGDWILEQGRFNLIDSYFTYRISKVNLNLKEIGQSGYINVPKLYNHRGNKELGIYYYVDYYFRDVHPLNKDIFYEVFNNHTYTNSDKILAALDKKYPNIDNPIIASDLLKSFRYWILYYSFYVKGVLPEYLLFNINIASTVLWNKSNLNKDLPNSDKLLSPYNPRLPPPKITNATKNAVFKIILDRVKAYL